jgi:hypothetical protein
MIGIYVLITFFSQMHSLQLELPDINGTVAALLEEAAEPMILSTSFAELRGIGVGTSVLSDGERVGRVTAVEPLTLGRGSEKRRAGLFSLKLSIQPRYSETLQEGTVALISAPRVGKRQAAEPVVELLSPRAVRPRLRSGTSIRGFESIEKFWIS